MNNKKIDVTALGEAMIEFNQTNPQQPQYLQGFGGDTSNAVIAAARAGVSTAYLTRLGDDMFGDLLRELWLREQVQTQAIETDASLPTGMYFVTHGQAGHTFTYRRAGSAASNMTPRWLQGAPTTVIEQSEWLHLSGITLAISPEACDTAFAAMHIARKAATKISFDSNLRLKLWPLERARSEIIKAISLCELFLPSLEDMVALTELEDPQSIIDWSHAHGAQQVVLKLGAEGALISDPQNIVRLHVPGNRVQAVDATGAGDCFCGNLLARLARGDDLPSATHYANAAASLTVQGWGAVNCLPTAAQTHALLAR